MNRALSFEDFCADQRTVVFPAADQHLRDCWCRNRAVLRATRRAPVVALARCGWCGDETVPVALDGEGRTVGECCVPLRVGEHGLEVDWRDQARAIVSREESA